MLPSALPNRIVVEGARYDKLPERLQHKVTLEMFNSVLDRRFGSPSLRTSLPLSRLGTRRLGISYVPATAADDAVINSTIAAGNDSLALYLIRGKPTIRLDDVDLAIGGDLPMGADQFLDVILSSPQGQERVSYTEIAGDEIVVSINAAGIQRILVEQRLQKVPNNTAPENLHQIGLHYWNEADILTWVMEKIHQVKAQRIPSVGVFSSPLSVIYNFGIPNKGYYLQRSIDIKRSVHAVGAETPTVRARFISDTGAVTSYLESSILEQLVRNWQGTAFSAVQVLMDANAQGIPIYQIDTTNQSQVLPLLAINDADAMSDINNALNTGMKVIVPKRAPTKTVGVSGIGYILRDPATGAAAYRISGGLNGGAGEAPCAMRELRPLTQSIQDIVLTALVLAAAAALVAVVVAGTAGTAAAPVAALMAGVGLGALTFEATAGEFCNPIPTGTHLGGNTVHNDCADLHPPNEYKGSDVCVSDGVNQKNFDAISGGKRVLWEAKTYNFDNGAPASFLIPIIDKPEWEKESSIARNCGLGYRYLVGDARHPAALEAIQASFVPIIADAIEVDPVNCLQPLK